MSDLVLYTYWRSSAAYRVRIALGLKGLEAEHVPVHLVKDGGEQKSEAYRAVNPHGLVPALVHRTDAGDVTLSNSLSIIEYLEEVFPANPLLPSDPAGRARVRQIALAISADIHPLQNLRVLQRAAQIGGEDAPISVSWAKHWIEVGFDGLEAQLGHDQETGTCCHGDVPGLADACLVPMVANAVRYGVDMARYPVISRINDALGHLPAFVAARPENQPDAE